MSSVVIKGDTSGQVTLAAPAVAGTVTVTMPSASGTMATNANGDLYPLTSGTAQASTSGTSIDFTGIPSWVKRITVMFAGVSTSGTSPIGIQLGTGSTTYTTTGYSGSATGGATGVSTTASSNTMVLQYVAVAASTVSGALYLINVSGNTWVESGCLGSSGTGTMNTSGNSITLAAALTAVRITTVGGTDTFDAGSINILYE